MSGIHPRQLANPSDNTPITQGMRVPSGNPAMFWAMAYKVSDVLMTLTEKGLIASLAQAPATVDELASVHGWKAAPLGAFLDLLVTTGVLMRSEGRYSLPSTTQAVLPIVTMEAQVRRWHGSNRSLQNVLETGEGAKPLTQISEADFLGNYLRAMASSARALALHLYRYASLPSEGSIVDVGGADGALARHLSALLPRTQYCVVDRAPVRQYFDAHAATNQAGGRIRFVDDDIVAPEKLEAEIKQARAVIISNVLHLLSEGETRGLLGFLRANMPESARLVVYDQFLDAGQFSAADLMLVDWTYLGTTFNLTDDAMSALLVEHGFVNVGSRRFPLLPGALVCASVP
jgi:O-methyltransferase domain